MVDLKAVLTNALKTQKECDTLRKKLIKKMHVNRTDEFIQ
jgi:hypothetical protein